MTVVGVGLTKIETSRKKMESGKIDIRNNIIIKSVGFEELKFAGLPHKVLKLSFLFECKYTPELGKIKIEGDVLWTDNEDKIKELKKEWDKTKKLPSELAQPVLNAALEKTNITALNLSQYMGLPSPVPLPKVTPGKGK